jgi:hypothetical protein
MLTQNPKLIYLRHDRVCEPFFEKTVTNGKGHFELGRESAGLSRSPFPTHPPTHNKLNSHTHRTSHEQHNYVQAEQAMKPFSVAVLVGVGTMFLTLFSQTAENNERLEPSKAIHASFHAHPNLSQMHIRTIQSSYSVDGFAVVRAALPPDLIKLVSNKYGDPKGKAKYSGGLFTPLEFFIQVMLILNIVLGGGSSCFSPLVPAETICNFRRIMGD